MLEAQNVYKSYHNGKKELTVLKGVNLHIAKGKFVAIVGPSGAGKTTLLHLLGGLDSPSEGKVTFEGKDLYGLSDAEISRVRNLRIGFVFQFYHLLSEFTVFENVQMPALLTKGVNKIEKSRVKERAAELLRKVGLGERTVHFPTQLSGGEKQRVALARSLMNSPGLLLCDEPTGNLDSKTGAEIIALIKQLNLKDAMTVVLVTHNKELTLDADAVYHLKDGVLVN